VSQLDIVFARELGYRIKLLGITRLKNGRVEQRVHPCLVPLEAPIANVHGALNAVVAEGRYSGNIVLEGAGAGGAPTASAVVSDLVRIARGVRRPTFGVPASALKSLESAPMTDHVGPYYIRLMVLDQPGVIADVAAILRDENVSMESMLQHGRSPHETVPVVLTTHETVESAMTRALEKISRLATVVEPPRMIRIEPF
jgi:homoserine dehydrogenase